VEDAVARKERAEMVVDEEGVVRVEEVVAVAMEVDVAAAVLGTVGAGVGVVWVEGVVAETVEVDKVAELLVAAEGTGREVGGGASRSNTQSNCIPTSLNTRMTGSPRMNRRLSAGMENGTHARAVATVAVEVADSAAWGAMAEEEEARGKVEAMAAAAEAGATVVTVAAGEAGVVTAAYVAAGSKEEGEQGEANAEAREAGVGRLETSEGERKPQTGPRWRLPARAPAPSPPSSTVPR